MLLYEIIMIFEVLILLTINRRREIFCTVESFWNFSFTEIKLSALLVKVELFLIGMFLRKIFGWRIFYLKIGSCFLILHDLLLLRTNVLLWMHLLGWLWQELWEWFLRNSFWWLSMEWFRFWWRFLPFFEFIFFNQSH